MREFRFLFLVMSLCSPALLFAQMNYEPDELQIQEEVEEKQDSTQSSDSEIKDLGDVFRGWFGKNKDKPPREQKKVTTLILPNISYNPTNGLLLGVGGAMALYLGPKETTKISFAGFSAGYTSKNQILVFLKSQLYTEENRYFLSGDWRYYSFSALTYGLGTNAPDSVEIDPSWGFQGAVTSEEGGYPMLFDFIKFHEIGNIKIRENLYAGIGYHLDYYYNIKDNLLNLDTVPLQLTPHYVYSEYYDFNPETYTLSGVSLNVMYDSRDNMINAYKGFYGRINYRMNPTWLGSSQNSTQLWAEFRTYVGLSKKIPRHLLAFWVYGSYQVSGRAPYFTLMGLGEDEKGRSGRGYIGGRFRGEDYMYAEVEYRFPILRRSQTLGGVVFANATTASNVRRDVHLFNYIEPGVGLGFRILVNKHTRMNICIDLGWGFQSQGVFFSGSEAF